MVIKQDRRISTAKLIHVLDLTLVRPFFIFLFRSNILLVCVSIYSCPIKKCLRIFLGGSFLEALEYSRRELEIGIKKHFVLMKCLGNYFSEVQLLYQLSLIHI